MQGRCRSSQRQEVRHQQGPAHSPPQPAVAADPTLRGATGRRPSARVRSAGVASRDTPPLQAPVGGSGAAPACGPAWARTWTRSTHCLMASGAAPAAWYVPSHGAGLSLWQLAHRVMAPRSSSKQLEGPPWACCPVWRGHGDAADNKLISTCPTHQWQDTGMYARRGSQNKEFKAA